MFIVIPVILCIDLAQKLLVVVFDGTMIVVFTLLQLVYETFFVVVVKF